MPLKIIRNDITKMKVDAIVNAANESLLGGGGVDGAIHRAAGRELLAECRTLGGCKTGDAKITGGYRLPCRYVIHTVGPVWQGGDHGEEALLRSCYATSLQLAKEHHCESVAFPLISSGVYGYPKDQALKVAIDTIGAFLFQNDMTVYLVIYGNDAYQISRKLFSDIASYIDDHYVEEHTDFQREELRGMSLRDRKKDFLTQEKSVDQERGIADSPNYFAFSKMLQESTQEADKELPPRRTNTSPDQGKDASPFPQRTASPLPRKSAASLPRARSKAPTPDAYPIIQSAAFTENHAALSAASLTEAVDMLDESFSEMLLRKIDEKGLTDVQCYKRANIDRKLFSKIRSDPNYRPSKATVLAFAIGLELPLNETREMLMKAGFALSHSNKFDIIVEYFILHGNYNIFEINEALFAFDQNLLGA